MLLGLTATLLALFHVTQNRQSEARRSEEEIRRLEGELSAARETIRAMEEDGPSLGKEAVMRHVGCKRTLEMERNMTPMAVKDYYSEDIAAQRAATECQSAVGGESDAKYNSSGIRIAFSILGHHNFGILEELMGLIFSPRHSYCIFVDSKATDGFKASVEGMAECYRKKHPEAKVFVGSFWILMRRYYWCH